MILMFVFLFFICSCIEANLNGVYQTSPLGHDFVGIIWYGWLGDYSLRSVRMMIREKSTDTVEAENGASTPLSLTFQTSETFSGLFLSVFAAASTTVAPAKKKMVRKSIEKSQKVSEVHERYVSLACPGKS